MNHVQNCFHDCSQFVGDHFTLKYKKCKHPHHVHRTTVEGKCITCEEIRTGQPQCVVGQLNTDELRKLATVNRVMEFTTSKEWYTPATPCTRCHTTAERTMDDSQCAGCNTLDAMGPKAVARFRRHKYYTPAEPCADCGEVTERSLKDDSCRVCNQSPRQVALAAGERLYTPTTPCPRCNTTAQRRVDNGQCSGCVERRESTPSPRQVALAAGERWYTPGDPCTKCNTTAQRRVDNGQCAGCVPARSRSVAVTRSNADTCCSACGVQAPVRIDNGACLACWELTADERAFMEATTSCDRETAGLVGVRVYLSERGWEWVG